ncbi:MAG: Sialate O-acetylesterase [Pedosphaera sp.]|nr:Sialate O-acetylesterase [Pedosphaera sp.]
MIPAKNIARSLLKTSFIALLFCAVSVARAEVKLNNLFSDGMVLQQGVAVPVWGTAKDGEKVTVNFQGQTVTTTAKNGRWLVRLKPLKHGGPFTMNVAGENQLTVTNVLVGEVWVASGQSNMSFVLSRASTGPAAIAAANDPQLRLFTVPHEAADEPKTEVAATWKECTSETASNFSAVAYFFGRDLRQARKVPIGLIDASVGGTPAESWLSRKALDADPELKEVLERYAAAIKKFESDPTAKPASAPEKSSASAAKPASGRKSASPPADPRRSAKRPSGLYNAMIAPLQPYAIAGAIWYQGEANAGRAKQYQKLFPALIQDWRQAWDTKDLPFLFVQIAPYGLSKPEIREAQLLVWQKVPHTAMAIITDHGEEKNIHPVEKEPVGHRLALAARAIAYHEKLEYSGPVYKSMKVKGNEAILSFTHADGGLAAHDGGLKGFTIAGADGNFIDATAKIKKDKVIISSPSITKPVAVRYGWSPFVNVNLFNKEGLPATTFRTDIK